jgi:uncharacterized membrane protein YqjE
MSDSPNASPRPGLKTGMRRLLQGVAGLGVSRFELLVLELQEEKLRFVWLVAMVGGAVVLGGLGLALLTVAVILVCPESGRVLLALSMGLAYGFGAAYLGWRLRRWLRDSPPAFEETRRQFEKDREWLKDST